MRISKRWLLVFLVAGTQLGCVLAAVACFAPWLHDELKSSMRRQVLDDNRQFATQMAIMIRAMHLRDLRVGTPDWTRLQDTVEQITLPNQGFVCVIENVHGRILCHPQLRHEPSLTTALVGQTVLEGPGSRGRIIDIPAKGSGGGWASIGGDIHVIGVSDLPELNVKVLAHQSDAGVEFAAAQVVEAVRMIGTFAGVGLCLLSAALTAGVVRRYENRVANANAGLEVLVEKRSRSLMKTRDAVIFGLAKLAESRDDDTGAHLERIRDYVEVLATEMARDGAPLDDDDVRVLTQAASLHDIGKVGVPDAVLCKPGRLTPEERLIIQKHPLIGGDCLVAVKQSIGDDDFLTTACEIAFSHHERWDGGGYPFGLSGPDIPLAGRIVAVADVYDALTSKRVYKDAMPHEEAARIITDGSGTQFDPAVIRAFLRHEKSFAKMNGTNAAKPLSAAA